MKRNATQYFVNGNRLDDDRAASLITAITSTSPIPSIPSLRHILAAQTSLLKVATLAKCKKIIVFDGVSPPYEPRRDAYEAYKQAVVRLTDNTPSFSQADLIFCKEWVHLSGALREAVEHVTTPFLFIHQHDDVLTKPFDLNGCIASMLKNPKIKHIHLARYTNKGRHAGGMYNSWDGPVDAVVRGGSEVPLTRCFGWSDYSHVTTLDYLRNFVLPKCGHGFPETFLHRAFKEALKGKTNSEITEVHLSFGTFLYGGLSDGNFIRHTDGSRDLRSDSDDASTSPFQSPKPPRLRRLT